MSANPHANGGLLLEELVIPDFRDYAVCVIVRSFDIAKRPKSSGSSCATSIVANPRQFRLFGPDETASNRLQAVFEVTNRQWEAERLARTTTLPRLAE